MYLLKSWTVSPTGVVVPAVVDPGALPGAAPGEVPGAEGNRWPGNR